MLPINWECSLISTLILLCFWNYFCLLQSNSLCSLSSLALSWCPADWCRDSLNLNISSFSMHSKNGKFTCLCGSKLTLSFFGSLNQPFHSESSGNSCQKLLKSWLKRLETFCQVTIQFFLPKLINLVILKLKIL